jgi:hypothetical protein
LGLPGSFLGAAASKLVTLSLELGFYSIFEGTFGFLSLLLPTFGATTSDEDELSPLLSIEGAFYFDSLFVSLTVNYRLISLTEAVAFS